MQKFKEKTLFEFIFHWINNLCHDLISNKEKSSKTRKDFIYIYIYIYIYHGGQ